MYSSKTIGLIVAGGKSSRMGLHKSQLTYHGLPQLEWLKTQLREFVDEIKISVSEAKPNNSEQLADSAIYPGKGPIASLASFNDAFPGKDIFVIACDYPFFNRDEMYFLFKESKNRSIACWDETEKFYHPYLACYSSSFLQIVKEKVIAGETSMQKILVENKIPKHRPGNPDALLNANTMKEFEYAMGKLAKRD